MMKHEAKAIAVTIVIYHHMHDVLKPIAGDFSGLEIGVAAMLIAPMRTINMTLRYDLKQLINLEFGGVCIAAPAIGGSS